MSKELDLKESIVLDDDFKKWMDAADKINEGVHVSDPEMQKHIDTYEKHLEKAPHAPGATTDAAGLEQEDEKSIKELQAPPAGGMGAAGMGTQKFAMGQQQGQQQGGMQVQQALPQNPANTTAELKKLAMTATNNPQLRADPNVQQMIALINQLK